MKNNIYNYTVYGLNIKSEIELPELISIDDKHVDISDIDVTIRYGDLSQDKKRIKSYGVLFVDRYDMYVAVEEDLIYNVKNGNEIIISHGKNIEKREIRSFLLGWVFGVLFIQRNMVAIHGSTIIKNGKGIIIAGDSGAGKTTLTAGLKLKGYKFITDDVSALDMENYDMPMIHPSYPEQKICKDAMKKLGYKVEEYEPTRKVKNIERPRYIIKGKESFCNEKVIIGAICEIVVEDIEKVKIDKITGAEKIKLLIDNGYLMNLEQRMGLRQDYFEKYLKLAKNIPFYRITRPKGKFTINEQIELFEKVI